MKFTPKTKKEIQNANIWEAGVYDFEILEADESTDKNGNDMIKLKVKVFKDNGGYQFIFDYVSGAWMEHKLFHLCDVCGLSKQYESGELEAYMLVGKTGKAKVGVSVDKTGQYADRNDIKDYVTEKSKAKSKTDDSDSIPF